MGQSDLRDVTHRMLVNEREGRLRAGWRVLVGVVVFVAALALAGGAQQALVATQAGTPLVAAGVVLLGWLVFYGGATGSLVGLSWVVDHRTLPGLGLGGDGWWRNLGFGLLLGVAMPTAVFAVELALGFITIDGLLVTRPENQFGVVVPPLIGVVGTFCFFVGVGVFEEVLSRGYLFNNIAEGLAGEGATSASLAILIAGLATSVLFGLLHFANPGTTLFSTVNITAVGLFFAGTYVATGDLGIPIGIHITWNFSLSSLFGFPVSGLTTPATVISVRQTGPELITGGRFGPEGGLVLYLGLAVGVLATVWWIRRAEGGLSVQTDVANPDLRSSKAAKPGRPQSNEE